MVIVNPKLSLPTDLPYKKRQRPFNPNTNLHQATIRFNEALRKQYNDIQFAKRFENGAISQNELVSVNTVDIGKRVDAQLFVEMSNLNSLHAETSAPAATRKRKSKKFFICSGSSISDAIKPGSSYDHTINNNGHSSPRSGGTFPNAPPSQNEEKCGMISNTSYDCNNTDMFPQLSATLPSPSTENEKTYFSRCSLSRHSQPDQTPTSAPSTTSSLEAQAINEYEPNADSAHDMIFGNVMGLHYGNYIHDHLWPPNQPGQNQHMPLPTNTGHNNDPSSIPCQYNSGPQNYHNTQQEYQAGLVPPLPPNHHPNVCGGNKSVGFNLPSSSSSSGINCVQQNPYLNMNFLPNSSSGLIQAIPSNSMTGMGAVPNPYVQQVQMASVARSSSRPRSTSVPRPRARKETLKQAAIRCGIIKGNQTVPVIPRRSHCILPLQLASAQSDPAVSVVELLHPRTLIPTSSSEAMVDENNNCCPNSPKFLNHLSTGDNYNMPCDTGNVNEGLGKENIAEDGKLLTQISSISDFRILDGALSCILNKYIGAYFENIDASQLTGSIFGGGVQLRDISLRSSVLENLGIPFHVVAGKCGSLEIKYSLTRLYSEPVTVTVKDLYLLVIPTRCVEYDANEEARIKQQEKMRQLEMFESIKHHVMQIHERKAQSKAVEQTVLSEIANVPQEASYFDMWVMTVLRNILLKVESVHVRFEDDVTNKDAPFALGVTLQKFSVLTTDATWRALFVKEYALETIFKLVDITGLNMYWNPAPTTMYKDLDDKKIVFLRMGAIEINDSIFKSMFGPVSLELKIQVTPFPDDLKEPYSKPRILIDSSLDKLTVTASDTQFHEIIPFLETLDLLMKSHKFRQYRRDLHEVEYKGHYKEWWQYAYTCVLEDIRRKRNNFRWKNIAEHRRKCRKYCKAYYKKKIENRTSPEIENTLTQLEKELDLFNLILLRKHAELIGARPRATAQPTTQNAQEGSQGYSSWLSSWLWSAPSPQPPPVPSHELTQSTPANVQSDGSSTKEYHKTMFSSSYLTKSEKEELWIAVGFAKNNDLSNCPEDYADVEANLLLNKFIVLIHEMRNKRKESILEAVLRPVSISFRNRPSIQSIEVEMKMGKIEAYGGEFPSDSQNNDIFSPPQILTTANPGGTEYFLKLTYEKAPLGSEVDHKVSLEGLALQFTYHAEAIDRIIDCFTIPNKPAQKHKGGKFPAGKIPAAHVLRQVAKFKNSPTSKLLKIMENKGKVELSLCLISPYIVIPLDTSVRGKSNFIVVQLGEINVVGTVIGGTICEHGGCSSLI